MKDIETGKELFMCYNNPEHHETFHKKQKIKITYCLETWNVMNISIEVIKLMNM
jgi:hypothetical protein